MQGLCYRAGIPPAMELRVKAAVITFPGSNCDRDLAVAFRNAGFETTEVWHKDSEFPAGTDLVGVPGGFSYGDYLRSGAIAAQSPIMRALAGHAARGGYVIGICNGFQILTESRLLPGALMRNSGLRFICREVALEVGTSNSVFTSEYRAGETIRLPVAHHDGNYQVGAETAKRLADEDRIAFRYAERVNGSENSIAGVLSENRRVLGLMPHPERAADPALGNSDGKRLFGGILQAVVAA